MAQSIELNPSEELLLLTLFFKSAARKRSRRYAKGYLYKELEGPGLDRMAVHRCIPRLTQFGLVNYAEVTVDKNEMIEKRGVLKISERGLEYCRDFLLDRSVASKFDVQSSKHYSGGDIFYEHRAGSILDEMERRRAKASEIPSFDSVEMNPDRSSDLHSAETSALISIIPKLIREIENSKLNNAGRSDALILVDMLVLYLNSSHISRKLVLIILREIFGVVAGLASIAGLVIAIAQCLA